MTKEEIMKEGWQVWEQDQKTNPEAVNPHAFTYGYLYGKQSAVKEESIEFAIWLTKNYNYKRPSEVEKSYQLFKQSKQQ